MEIFKTIFFSTFFFLKKKKKKKEEEEEKLKVYNHLTSYDEIWLRVTKIDVKLT
jgi:hypothetical protein